MMQQRDSVNAAYYAKWIVAIVVSVWARLPAPIQILFMLMFFDHLSGFFLALKEGRWSKQVGYWGLVTKAFTLLLIMACQFLATAAHIKFDVASGLSVVFSLNEFSSFMRNCQSLGVNIPPQVTTFLEKMRTLAGATVHKSHHHKSNVKKSTP